MNANRRKEIQRAVDMLEEAKSILENCRDEEQDALDNMPESLQESERGQKMEEYIDQLDNAISSVEESVEFAMECLV